MDSFLHGRPDKIHVDEGRALPRRGRRRAVYEVQPQAPIKILWAVSEPARAEAGCCPKCGKLVGQRLIRTRQDLQWQTGRSMKAFLPAILFLTGVGYAAWTANLADKLVRARGMKTLTVAAILFLTGNAAWAADTSCASTDMPSLLAQFESCADQKKASNCITPKMLRNLVCLIPQVVSKNPLTDSPRVIAPSSPTADAAPLFTAACAANPGRTIYVPSGVYNIQSTVLLVTACYFVGDGYNEYNQAGACPSAATIQGTWLHIPAGFTGLLPFVWNVTGLSGRFGFGNLAFCQDHPAPAGGWAPTVYQPVVTINGTGGEADFDNIYWYAIYDAINAQSSNAATGRLRFNHNSGQPFHSYLTVDNFQDTSAATDFHFWCFWSCDANVLAWEASNSVLFHTYRMDGFQIESLFGYGYGTCFETDHSANGITTALQIGSYICDNANVGFKNIGNNTFAQFGNFFSGSPAHGQAGAVGSVGILDTSAGSQISVSHFRTAITGAQAISLTNASTQVMLGDASIFNPNQDNGGFAVFDVASGSILKISSVPIVGGLPMGTALQSGAGRFNIPWTLAWTPSIAGSITPGTATYVANSDNGTYQVNGDTIQVYFNISLATFSGSPSGDALIKGLPYASDSTITNSNAGCSINYIGNISFDTNYTQLSAQVVPGTTTIHLIETNPVAGGSQVLPVGKLGTTGGVVGMCTYQSSS
jgi:hypothetical protein